MSLVSEIAKKYLFPKQNRKPIFFDLDDNAIVFGGAIEKFIAYAQEQDETAPNKSWYVGVTIDPEKRKEQHEREKGIECDLVPLVYSFNRKLAMSLEIELGKRGFAIITNDIKHLSVTESLVRHYVYIFPCY